jgi:hypothetical protein
VYLPDRGAAERRVVEPGEDSGGRRPEVFLDHLGDQLRGQRRDVVLHLRELCAVCGRQDVAPRREHLPELDEQRPEFLAGKPEMLGTSSSLL